MDDLDELVKWMRRNGVVELSRDGIAIRLSESSPPHASDEAQDTDDVASEARPPTPKGHCVACGSPATGLYATSGLCRGCGWKDVLGESPS